MIDTNDPETPRSLMEPEFERGNTPPKTRPRSSAELLNDGPLALRRRVEVPPQQLDLTPGELRAPLDRGACHHSLVHPHTPRSRGVGTPGVMWHH